MAVRAASGVVVLTMTCVAVSAGIGATGSVERGRSVFESQCAVCHATAPEFHKEGPSLAGVYGRRAGTAPFFAGYKALRGADETSARSTPGSPTRAVSSAAGTRR